MQYKVSLWHKVLYERMLFIDESKFMIYGERVIIKKEALNLLRSLKHYIILS